MVWGLGLQFIFALFILRWDKGFAAFTWLGDRVAEFLLFTDAGSRFIFGNGFEEHFFAFKVGLQSVYPVLTLLFDHRSYPRSSSSPP